MLQQVEYDPFKLLKWLATFPNIFTVAKRGKLVLTKASKALLLIIFSTQALLFGMAIVLLFSELTAVASVVFLLTPIFLVLELVVISLLGGAILSIKRASLIRSAEQTFINHSGQRIAILGSYGKTSMKELLGTVLGTKFKVATTPGNKNVAISHARWSTTLDGDEDVLVIEYGEGEPGDIDKLASLSHPNYAVVTGLAPNHLDRYKSIEALKSDLKRINNFVDSKNTYIHEDKTGLTSEFNTSSRHYNENGIDDWKVSDVKVDITGLKFSLGKVKQTIRIESELLGRHNIGPLSAVAVLALELGMAVREIEEAMRLTKPFEHRMQPYTINGAWVIDDAYNGNLEGFKSGLQLLSELEAKRKIYVTPGLVDQGEETERVHVEIGQFIAQAKPDKVVLMNNSVTDIIHDSMKESDFKGQVEIVNNPLEYYQNLDQFVAAGDLVMLQNDWTDNYN